MIIRLSDAESGKPLETLHPVAWVDLLKTEQGKELEGMTCKERVGLYLKGIPGLRPMIDLTSYYVLSMNRDASISVIDPIVGMTYMTKLFAQINLERPGADWAKTRDEKRLFVTMPLADAVAVVNTDTFKVIKNVEAGINPLRIVMQPDEKYLWVGNDARDPAKSGITVIDVAELKAAAFIPTGKGHHEIVLSDDNSYAFVSNRADGTVSIIDMQKLEKVKDLKTGPLPISVAFSRLSQALYAADGEEGVITVVDGQSHEVVERIAAKPGLGPLRFTEDGRWGVVVNSRENEAYVIDPTANKIAHTVAVGAKPYQVAFTRAFAYIYCLGTEKVSMIELAKLGKGEKVSAISFPAGAKPPEMGLDVGVGDNVFPAPGENAVLVVAPGENIIYYFVEGMTSPIGNFRNYGHMPRAVGVTDRTLREVEPGVYRSKVRLPEAGTYQVAFLLDTPRMLNCFEFEVKSNPLVARLNKPLEIEYIMPKRKVKVGETAIVRFKLIDPANQELRTDLKDVRVMYYAMPGIRKHVVTAKEHSPGIYEAELPIRKAGGHYVFVSSPSLNVDYKDLPFATLIGVK